MKGAGLGAWRWVVLAMVGAAAIGLSGCASGAAASSPGATVPDTTVPGGDPFAVPAHITVPYVQRVLNALDAVDEGTTKLAMQDRTLDAAVAARLHATYSDAEFPIETQLILTDIADSFAPYKSDPGPVRDSVIRVVSSSSSCVFVAVDRDYSLVSSNPPSPHTSYLELVRPATAVDPTINGTGWQLGTEGYRPDGSVPADPCA